MDIESSEPHHKIRLQITLTEQMSNRFQICRSKGLSDSTVIEMALFDYFIKNNIGA